MKVNGTRFDVIMMSHCLKMALRSILNLSYKDYVELKKYIEENF